MEQATPILIIVLLLAATAACAAVVWFVVEGVKTSKSVRILSEDLDARLIPLLDKADVTIDAANAELLRIDGIVTKAERATDRASDAAETVRDVVNAPVELVGELGVQIGRIFTGRG